MARWFWIWLVYSLAGYGLEKGFAAATHAQKQNRKGFLLLPLCPVYGFGVMAVLALPPAMRSGGALLLWGAVATTAVEYGVHWLYDRLLGVQFWNYSGVWGNLNGRVCVPFSLIWGVLTVIVVEVLQPWIDGWVSRVPPWITLAVLMLTAADAVSSIRVLQLRKDPEQLHLSALWKAG